jgi:hypothetical protein
MEDVKGLSKHSGTLHCGTPSTKNADGAPTRTVPRVHRPD